jgi:hypothetical protein
MYSGDTIPKMDKIAIVLIIAFILNLLFSTLSTSYLTALFGLSDYTQYSVSVHAATIINLIFGYLLISSLQYGHSERRKNKMKDPGHGPYSLCSLD